MWRRKRRQPDDTAAAQRSQERTDAVIELVESQHDEVVQMVTRLQAREARDHFADSLRKAMGGGT